MENKTIITNTTDKTAGYNRNSYIDIMKAVMILSVMVYHLIYRRKDGAADLIIREFIYLSIPLFVFLAGYFYREKGLPLMSEVGKRMKKLVLPSALFDLAVFLLFCPYFLIFHGYDVKSWFLDILTEYLRPELMEKLVPDYGAGQFFNNLSPIWYIWMLAFSTILFLIVMKLLKGSKQEPDMAAMIIAMLVLMIIGSVLYVYSPRLSWSLHITPLYAGIMIMAQIIRRLNVLEKLEKVNLALSSVIMVVLAVLHFVIFYNFGSDNLYLSLFGDKGFISAAFFIIEIPMGGYVLFTFARIVSLIEPLKVSVAWIGSHTLVNLLTHTFIGGIAADILHTYNKPGPYWYLDPLPTSVIIKSMITFVVALAGSSGLALLNDKLKKR